MDDPRKAKPVSMILGSDSWMCWRGEIEVIVPWDERLECAEIDGHYRYFEVHGDGHLIPTGRY